MLIGMEQLSAAQIHEPVRPAGSVTRSVKAAVQSGDELSSGLPRMWRSVESNQEVAGFSEAEAGGQKGRHMKSDRFAVHVLEALIVVPVLGGPAFAGGQDSGGPIQVGSMMTVDYAALVSRGDLDLKTPLGVADSAKPGLPIGNGRLGTLLWTPAQNTLAMQLNHTDVFAFRSCSVATRDAHQDYGNICGRVDIGFGEDVFRPETTRNQLGVYDALATVSGKGVRIRGLAWHAKDVIALEITDERAEPKPIRVELAMMRPAIQESGPHKAISKVVADGKDIELTQQFLEPKAQPLALDLNAFTSLRARVIGREATAEVAGDRVRLTTPAGKGSFVVLFSVGQSNEEPLEKVRAAATAYLDKAADLGFEKLFTDNRTYWHEFWIRSFISASGSNTLEEMTRFYIWGQYLAGICLRGNYPPKHSGMIFITQEYRPWGSLFWWFNESAQQGWQYEANRLELLDPVFRWNQHNLAAYANSAVRSWNSRGWYIPETSSWDGPEILPEGVHKPEGHRAGVHQSLRGGGWTTRNTYNMAKFATLYYKKYLYTGDEKWLKEKVYPAMRDTAEFYCGLKAGCQYAGGDDNGPQGTVILKKDADGKYHLYGTISHEHIWWGKDIIEDLAAIRGIFPVAIMLSKKYGVDADKRAEWQEVLANLAPYPRSEMPGAIGGLGEGTWCQGLPPNGKIRDNYGDESPRMGPVIGDFLDVLTLESANTQEWAVAMATLNKHPGTGKDRLCSCGQYAIVPARMGRADLVERALPAQMVSSYDQSRPGASHSLQGPGIFARAIHEALLLSIAPSPDGDPIIHVMESWPRKWDVSFRLQAKGGFLVSSSMEAGTIRFVEILSQLGGECRIRNPWPGTEVTLYCNGVKKRTMNESLLKFDTQKGKTYLLVSVPCWNRGGADGNAQKKPGKLDDLKIVVPRRPAG